MRTNLGTRHAAAAARPRHRLVGMPPPPAAAPPRLRRTPGGDSAGHDLPGHRHDHRPRRRHPRPDGAHATTACRSSAATSSCTAGPAGGAEGRQPDPRRAARLDASATDAGRRARPPPSPHGRRARPQSSPRLVVDATSGTGRAGVGGHHRRRRRPTARRAGSRRTSTPRTGKVMRREQQIETVDGSGQSLYSGTVPLQLTQSGSTYQLKDPTRGNTYTTDLNNKDGLAPLPDLRHRLPDRHAVHQPGHVVRQRQRPAAGSRRRSTRSTART